jgi:hypothetical protein
MVSRGSLCPSLVWRFPGRSRRAPCRSHCRRRSCKARPSTPAVVPRIHARRQWASSRCRPEGREHELVGVAAGAPRQATCTLRRTMRATVRRVPPARPFSSAGLVSAGACRFRDSTGPRRPPRWPGAPRPLSGPAAARLRRLSHPGAPIGRCYSGASQQPCYRTTAYNFPMTGGGPTLPSHTFRPPSDRIAITSIRKT